MMRDAPVDKRPDMLIMSAGMYVCICMFSVYTYMCMLSQNIVRTWSSSDASTERHRSHFLKYYGCSTGVADLTVDQDSRKSVCRRATRNEPQDEVSQHIIEDPAQGLCFLCLWLCFSPTHSLFVCLSSASAPAPPVAKVERSRSTWFILGTQSDS